MIYLNITFIMPQAMEGEFKESLSDVLKMVKADPVVVDMRLLRVLPQDDDTRISLQLNFDGIETLDEWQNGTMVETLRPIFDRFGERVLPYVSILEPFDL